MVITRASISHYLANIVISETHLQVILIPQMLEILGFMVLEYSWASFKQSQSDVQRWVSSSCLALYLGMVHGTYTSKLVATSVMHNCLDICKDMYRVIWEPRIRDQFLLFVWHATLHASCHQPGFIWGLGLGNNGPPEIWSLGRAWLYYWVSSQTRTKFQKENFIQFFFCQHSSIIFYFYAVYCNCITVFIKTWIVSKWSLGIINLFMLISAHGTSVRELVVA